MLATSTKAEQGGKQMVCTEKKGVGSFGKARDNTSAPLSSQVLPQRVNVQVNSNRRLELII